MFHRFSSKLRIGERIGLGFGLIGALLLAVIAQYHLSLNRTISSYQTLQDIYEVKEEDAQQIESQLLLASRAAKDFLLERDPAYAQEVVGHIDKLLERTAELVKLDEQGRRSGLEIEALATTYRSRFQDVADAWRRKGLDHNSGLQGAFRDSAHQLEALAGNYRVGPLYIQLLQIRRSEKDLGLRREAQYRDKVYALLDGFLQSVQGAALDGDVQRQLTEELANYRDEFTAYAGRVLANQDIDGGKGTFRDVAHRIEDLLNAHLIPNLEAGVLQLRRREKDYLLRHDKQYVDMALAELAAIRSLIQQSAVTEQAKAPLLQLTQAYEADFLALVEQNDRIDGLLQEMQQAAAQISPLVAENVNNANRVTETVTREINQSTRAKASWLLWISVAAALAGLLTAIVITRRLTRPVVRMAGFLDQLAQEDPTDRIPTVPGARDELNAMAESVNKIADHKANMIAWWKRSVDEIEVERDILASRLGASAREDAGGRH
jgi:methyl-accepting chemotaxis protein